MVIFHNVPWFSMMFHSYVSVYRRLKKTHTAAPDHPACQAVHGNLGAQPRVGPAEKPADSTMTYQQNMKKWCSTQKKNVSEPYMKMIWYSCSKLQHKTSKIYETLRNYNLQYIMGSWQLNSERKEVIQSMKKAGFSTIQSSNKKVVTHEIHEPSQKANQDSTDKKNRRVWSNPK